MNDAMQALKITEREVAITDELRIVVADLRQKNNELTRLLNEESQESKRKDSTISELQRTVSSLSSSISSMEKRSQTSFESLNNAFIRLQNSIMSAENKEPEENKEITGILQAVSAIKVQLNDMRNKEMKEDKKEIKSSEYVFDVQRGGDDRIHSVTVRSK